MTQIDRHSKIQRLRDYIASGFNRVAPRGMPPVTGLLYQPIPFAEFDDLPCERDSSPAKFQMIEKLVPLAGRRVLDLGCANGYFPFRIAQEDPRSRVVGIDRFEDNIEVCNSLKEIYEFGNVEFRCEEITLRNVERLFRENAFDVVLMLSVHHHLLRDRSAGEAKSLFRYLEDHAEVVIIEQGSLTQDEYVAWTRREEIFFTYAFTRLISMLEAAEIPKEHCFLIGEAMYLSGNRPDTLGSGRAIVGASKNEAYGSVLWQTSKRHANGMINELLLHRSGDSTRFLKHSLRWPSYLENEAHSLRRLSDGFFPRVVEHETDLARNMLTLQPLELELISASDGNFPLRADLIAALEAMATAGIVHNEIHPTHVLRDTSGRLKIIDFETAYRSGTDRSAWLRETFETNPKMGLDWYDRSLQYGDRWIEVDLICADKLLEQWGAEKLSAAEWSRFKELYQKSFDLK